MSKDQIINHSKHTQKRLYIRDKTKWTSTDLYSCSCGAVLAKRFIEKEKEGGVE